MWATIANAFNKGTAELIFTSDLVQRMVKLGASEATTVFNLAKLRETTKLAHEKKIEQVLNHLDALDRGRASPPPSRAVWEFVRDATRNQLWFGGDTAATYTWMEDHAVDPGMEQRYKALTAGQRAMVDEIFIASHKNREKLVALARQQIDAAYAGQLTNAGADAKARAAIEKEKRQVIEELLGPVRELPLYAPMQRVGSHVVIAKSQALLDAEAQGDQKRIDDLKKQDAHYLVTFRDGTWAATTEKQKMKALGHYAKVDAHEREQLGKLGDAVQFSAFKKLSEYLDEQDEGGQAIGRALANLYITTLSEAAARRSALPRLGVGGMAAQDMRRAFAAKGRADASFMAGLLVSEKERDAMRDLRAQVKQSGNEKTLVPLLNIFGRRLGSVEQEYSTATSRIMRLNSYLNLILKPSYYFYNATQPFVMTHPLLARRFGWSKSAKALTNALQDVVQTVKSKNLVTALADFADPEKMFKTLLASENAKTRQEGEELRDAIDFLMNAGRIDITITQDLGRQIQSSAESRAGQMLKRIDNFFTSAMQKSEMVNRLVTGIAAYRLTREQQGWTNDPRAKDSARWYAVEVIDRSQGDYSNLNAPRWINSSGWTRVITQFRKFQLIQVSYILHMMNDAFGGAPKEERAAARAALAYTLAHHALLAGIKGLPAYAAVSFAWGLLMPGDDDTLDEDLRKALGGGFVAELLMAGAPRLLGADISRNVGMGEAFSILPFADKNVATVEGFRDALISVFGPTVNNANSIVRGFEVLQEGDTLRALEYFAPSGPRGALRAWREAARGATTRGHEVLIPKAEIDAWDSIITALGFRTAKAVTVGDERARSYAQRDEFNKATTRIRRAYILAYRNRDTSALAEAREDWMALQDKKARNGLRRSPVSNLLRAPHEK